jgi:hypothetical protein
MTGLPPNDQFEISDDIPFSAPFSAAPAINVDDVLQQAYGPRQDLKAANARSAASSTPRTRNPGL